MARPMIFGTFTKFNMSHYHQGTWRLEEYSRGNREYQNLQSWIELAKMSEEAKIDFLMWADDLGSHGYFDGDLEEVVRNGIAGVMDNATLAGILAQHTEKLGFIVTSSTVQDHPFHFARRMSTLDWLTDGRIGWNIVTGVSPGMFGNFGMSMPTHDERYGRAHEYMDVVYKLWEQSWERDAPVHSIEQNVWADPAKVHEIDHVSEHYAVKGPHQVEPSPQGTPLLFQAGTSAQGKEFAVKHAEIQFIGGGGLPQIAEYITELRQMLVEAGRDPESMIFATGLPMIVGRTVEEAEAKRDMILGALDYQGVAAKLSARIGLDVSDFSRRVDLDTLTTEGIKAPIERLRRHFPAGYQPTVEEIVRREADPGIPTGTPEQMADIIQSLQDVGVGAILLQQIGRPGSLIDFIELVAPVLKERGLMRTEDDDERRTMRDRLFGNGDLLPETHTGAGYRRSGAAV